MTSWLFTMVNLTVNRGWILTGQVMVEVGESHGLTYGGDNIFVCTQRL